jgi:hypothetical protein
MSRSSTRCGGCRVRILTRDFGHGAAALEVDGGGGEMVYNTRRVESFPTRSGAAGRFVGEKP